MRNIQSILAGVKMVKRNYLLFLVLLSFVLFTVSCNGDKTQTGDINNPGYQGKNYTEKLEIEKLNTAEPAPDKTPTYQLVHLNEIVKGEWVGISAIDRELGVFPVISFIKIKAEYSHPLNTVKENH